jgi:hypothetical protein
MIFFFHRKARNRAEKIEGPLHDFWGIHASKFMRKCNL